MSGVQFPLDDKGKRSTTKPAKEIWASAFKCVDPVACEKIKKEPYWRKNYGEHLFELTRKSVETPEMTLQAAQDGLGKIYETFDFVTQDGKCMKLSEAMETMTESSPHTGFVESKGDHEVDFDEAVAVPFEGKKYAGQELIELLEKKCPHELEEDALAAIKDVVKNAKNYRKALKDTYFVLFGATSELCPFEKLLELGLNVIAIARPNAVRQGKLIKACQEAPKGATLTLPVLKTIDNPSALEDTDFLASVSGGDIIQFPCEIRNWLVNLYPGKKLVLGSYIYLDGANHVRASVAMDAVCKSVIEERPDTSLMYLGTPGIAYPITKAAYEDSVRRRSDDKVWWHSVTSTVLGPYENNVQEPLVAKSVNPKAKDSSREIYMYNGIANVQGPNYMLAKTLQNWRAMVARDVDKCKVSVNMTPTCATDSVMHVAHVARAVRGMKGFDPLTYFEPGTAKHVMALLMIYDMCAKESDANPNVELKNPQELFALKAVHGGLWRTAYSLESTGKTQYMLDLFGFV